MRWLLVNPRCNTLRVARLRQARHLSVTRVNHNKADYDENTEKPIDAQFKELGTVIRDDFANFKDHYDTPKHPIVLAHGLMGFDELRLMGNLLPGIAYWRGIADAMRQNNIEVITTAVPSTGSIKERAEVLHEQIRTKAPGKDVNIIAHSMGGLDSRYLISTIKPQEFAIKSLTTIATPHHGSSAADMILREIGPDYLPRLYALLARMGVSTGAFAQLTRPYAEEFNARTPNDSTVRYFSYGASAKPHLFSVFRISHDLMYELEGANDGLVSVKSSKWPPPEEREGGEGYKGTLMGVTHLDLINWTNRIKRVASRMGLVKQNFDAVAFYLSCADMLAKEGL